VRHEPAELLPSARSRSAIRLLPRGAAQFEAARAAASRGELPSGLRGTSEKCLAPVDWDGAPLCEWDAADEECFLKPVEFDILTIIAMAIISGFSASGVGREPPGLGLPPSPYRSERRS
jgi:hypothetical protein